VLGCIASRWIGPGSQIAERSGRGDDCSRLNLLRLLQLEAGLPGQADGALDFRELSDNKSRWSVQSGVCSTLDVHTDILRSILILGSLL